MTPAIDLERGQAWLTGHLDKLEQLANGLENLIEAAKVRDDKYDVGYIGAMLKMLNEQIAAIQAVR